MSEETAIASSEDQQEYRWNLLAAVVLSLATLASAWCGFQASSWSSVYADESRAANGDRFEAARQAGVADRQLTSDLMIFSMWLEAEVVGGAALADEVEARFRPHFRPAFDAWRALPSKAGTHLPEGSPFDQPAYVLPTQAAADAAIARVERALDAADTAGAISSRYVLTSVLFASVLFLAGIASRLSHRRLTHGVVAVAASVLLAAMWFLLSSPAQF